MKRKEGRRGRIENESGIEAILENWEVDSIFDFHADLGCDSEECQCCDDEGQIRSSSRHEFAWDIEAAVLNSVAKRFHLTPRKQEAP